MIEFTAKVQAVDSRTGATLLKMDTGKLPAAPMIPVIKDLRFCASNYINEYEIPRTILKNQ